MMKMNLQFFAHKKGVGSTKNCLLYTSRIMSKGKLQA